MEKITTQSGREKSGSLQDLIDLANAAAQTHGDLVVFCIGEDGKPCNLEERTGLACGSDSEVNWDAAGEPWIVTRTTGKRFKVASSQGIEVAPIGNPNKASFSNGADFLKSFFQFGHQWPLGDSIQGNLNGTWVWAVIEAFSQHAPVWMDDFSSLTIEGSGTLAGVPFSLSALSDEAIPDLLAEDGLVLAEGLKLYYFGRALVIELAYHVDDDFSPPLLKTNRLEPWASDTLENYFVAGAHPAFYRVSDSVNGFASSEGVLFPALVTEESIEGRVTLWTPERQFGGAIFEP